MLTGCPCSTIYLENKNKDETWSKIKEHFLIKVPAVATCGYRNDKPNDSTEPIKIEIYKQVNLVSNHGYSFLYTVELKQNNESIPLIQLRNP